MTDSPPENHWETVNPDAPARGSDTGESPVAKLHIVCSEDSHAYVLMPLEEMQNLLSRGNPMLLTEVGGKRTIIMPQHVVYVNENDEEEE